MRYLALSNRAPLDVCEYPDSAKVGISSEGPRGLLGRFRAETSVDYYDREEP